MLYELVFEDVETGGDRLYQTLLIEAPAHRRGRLPQPLVDEADRLAKDYLVGEPDFRRVRVQVCEYQPRRVGYRTGNIGAISVCIDEWRATADTPTPVACSPRG